MQQKNLGLDILKKLGKKCTNPMFAELQSNMLLER